MKIIRVLTSSIATIVALSPFAAHAAADTLSGAAPAWGTAANWSLGAIPGTGDNAIIAATGAVDVRGSTLTGFKEIQDITFNSTAAVSLTNNSSSTDMLLALNGGRGAGVPLISTVGDIAYAITGPGTNGTPHPLGLQLRASGDISVAANVLTITSVISQNGGPRSINKTGAGRLTLGGANTFSGGVTVTAGILEATVNGALGTGPAVINGGTLEINLAVATLTTSEIELNAGGQLATRGTVTLNNNVTINGGTLATRTTDGGTFAGAMNVIAPSFVNLRSYTSPANDLNITISGVFSGASDFTINGNASNATSGKALILTNTGTNFSGNYNVSAGQSLRNLPAASGKTIGTGTVHLNGGVLDLRDNGAGSGGTLAYGNNVVVSTGASTINVDRVGANLGNAFELGTLSIGAQTLNSTGANNYFVRFAGATTMTGAATFNPTTAGTVLGGAVGGAFDLTKTGGGVLQLNAANTYSGNTHINAGTLVLNGSIASSPRIDVRSGGTLDVTTASGGFTLGGTQILSGNGNVTGVATVASGGRIEAGDALGAGTLTMSNLTLGTVAGDTATLLLSPSASALPINVTATDGLVANGGAGKVTINIGGANPTIGTHPLIGYSGVIGGGVGSFVLGTLPTPRLAATLQSNATSIYLDVTGVDAPFWSGDNGTQWSTNVLAPMKNWGLNTGTGTPTDFLTSDSVTFDDSATGAAITVDVSVNDVIPSAILFSNASKPYTITGSKAIAGSVGITKTGAAKVTITNTNSFTGPVSVSGGGTLSVASVANAGSDSALGAGSTITLDDGTLEYTGASGSTNRPVTLGAAGGTVKADPVGAALTLSGVVSGAGLTKTGAGKVILTGAANTYTNTVISDGILQAGDGVTNGTLGTGTIENHGTLAFNNPAAQTLTQEIFGTGALTKTGGGNLVLAGGVANSYGGATTVSGGNLILSKTSGINAIGGDVFVETGGTVSYGTTGGQLQDHIIDSANITINGGTFGSGAGNTPDGPTAGITDTVTGVTVNSGTFYSGRNALVSLFKITTLLKIAGGTVLAQRGGGIDAYEVQFTAGTLNLDGGSTGQQSRLTVDAGGLLMAGTTINFNAGPSPITAGSTGSILTLNGNVNTTGTSALARLNPTVSSARVDLFAGNRTFDVTGTLTIGTTAAPVTITNGALTKAGDGTLFLAGANTYGNGTTIEDGTLNIDGNAALGDLVGGVTIDNNAILQAAAPVSSDRSFTLGSGGGRIDTNGHTVTLAADSSITGATLTKIGTGTLVLGGTQDYTALINDDDRIDVLTAIGTGTSTVTANAGEINFAFDQTLESIDIADGATVSVGDLPPPAPPLGAALVEGAGGSGAAAVPEPGSVALLLAGALSMFGRRRRNG